MQRRAAAMYFAFFLVLGAAAYGLLVTTSAPTVAMDGDSYASGDPITLGERDYTVASVDSGGEGELSWVNESATLSATLDNGSEVAVTAVSWDGQMDRYEATFEDGETIPFNDSQYTVGVNGSAPSLTLTDAENANLSETFAVGDSLTYQQNETTVTEIGSSTATVVWGGPYVVDVNNESVSNPTNATLVEVRDYGTLAEEDPSLYNQTTRIDGTLYVTLREEDQNVPVEEYFGPKERHLISENGTLDYNGNETTVASVTNESVELTWAGTATNTIEFEEGENFTAGVPGSETQYFPFFPDNSSVKIFETDQRFGEYSAQTDEKDDYDSRMLGLWGIVDLSILAVIILLMSAYLPVRG